jgi:hypothetical protein
MAESFLLDTSDWKKIFGDSTNQSSSVQTADTIRQGMTPLFDNSGVFHEAPFYANSSGNYNIDYCTGRGVFMRYLARVDQVFRGQPGWSSSSVRVRSTADAVIARLAEPNPTLYSWNYPSEEAVLDVWKAKVKGSTEGTPSLCNPAILDQQPAPQLVFYGIALDALTAAMVAVQ